MRRTISSILREESAARGYTIEEILSQRKTIHLARCRQYAIWRARKETQRSLTEIGRVFKRDHTTVLHAIRVIDDMTEEQRNAIGEKPQPRKNTAPLKPLFSEKLRLKARAETYPGEPCRHGHDGRRYVTTGACVHCKQAQDRKRYPRKKLEADAWTGISI